MKILFVKGDTVINVRLAKFLRYFRKRGIPVCFWGWNRSKTNTPPESLDSTHYLMSGGGYGGNKVFFLYPIWILKVFFRALFSSTIKEYEVIAVNFDSALPIYLASRIRGFSYIYEIRDEFALSYDFRPFFKKVISKIDHAVMRNAKFVIHVDANRVTYQNCNYIIIENSPEDYFQGKIRTYDSIRLQYAVIGNISRTRGIDQIYKFARENENVSILLVGKFYDEDLKRLLLSLSNLEYHDFMPQNELFSLMERCCGVFSLYDPCLEINKLAASNKVYDAMMMGIPVITNKEVMNSSIIVKAGCGVVVEYEYGQSWSSLADSSFLEKAKLMGVKGREIYLRDYQFEAMVDSRLFPLLQS